MIMKIGSGPPGNRGPWAVGRAPGPRAAGSSSRRAAGPWRAVGRGPAFNKTLLQIAENQDWATGLSRFAGPWWAVGRGPLGHGPAFSKTRVKVQVGIDLRKCVSNRV